jgi:type IV pilus assembly protein PilQ
MFLLSILVSLSLLSACVTTDERGRNVEKTSLKDIQQTIMKQKLSLSGPEKVTICPQSSKDMQITLDAMARAHKYVHMITPKVQSSYKLPAKEVSVEFTDTEIREALLDIADQTGVNIIAGDEVSGTVSLKMSDATLGRVLRATLAAGGYEYTYNGNYVYVGDAQKKEGASATAFLTRHSYKTVSSSPKQIIDSLNLDFKQYVVGNDSMGIVSIAAPRREFQAILQDVVTLDRPSKQVRLRLSVAYVSDSAMDTLGKKVSGTAYSAANVLAPIQPSFAQGVYDKNSFDQFLRSIQLMSQTGEAEIKAEPQIIVMDGEQAKFGSKQVSLIRRSDGLMDKNNSLEGGIQMKIEPRIVDQNSVQLNIEDAKSGDVNEIERDSTNEHSISTKVRVKTGDTLVLGGLRQAKTQTLISKVPFLGDIPYVGWLFKNKREQVRNTQVIFAVTPEIVCN